MAVCPSPSLSIRIHAVPSLVEPVTKHPGPVGKWEQLVLGKPTHLLYKLSMHIYHGTTINTGVPTGWDAFNFLFLPSHRSPCFVWLHMGSRWSLIFTLAENWNGLLPSKAFPVYFLVTGLRMCRHMCEPVFIFVEVFHLHYWTMRGVVGYLHSLLSGYGYGLVFYVCKRTQTLLKSSSCWWLAILQQRRQKCKIFLV